MSCVQGALTFDVPANSMVSECSSNHILHKHLTLLMFSPFRVVSNVVGRRICCDVLVGKGTLARGTFVVPIQEYGLSEGGA